MKKSYYNPNNSVRTVLKNNDEDNNSLSSIKFIEDSFDVDIYFNEISGSDIRLIKGLSEEFLDRGIQVVDIAIKIKKTLKRDKYKVYTHSAWECVVSSNS